MLNTAQKFTKKEIVNDALDLPPAAAVAKECWPFLSNLRPKERKQVATAIGGMIRTIMVENGYETTGTKRAVPPVRINGQRVRVFKTAEVYRKRSVGP